MPGTAVSAGVTATQPAQVQAQQDPLLEAPKQPERVIGSWEEALQLARASSTNLRIAMLDIQRGEAQRRSALAAMLPTITAGGTASKQFLFNETSQVTGVNGLTPVFTNVRSPFPASVTGNVSLTEPLFAPRLWWAAGTADANMQLVGSSLDEAKRKLTIAVAQGLIGVFTAERVAELNRVGLRNSLQRLDLAERRLALGAATGLDVVRARQDVATARATLLQGDESLRRAREALGISIGVPQEVGVASTIQLDGLVTSANKFCKPNANLEDRSDLAALHAREVLANRAHKDVEFQFVPTVTAQSTLAATTTDVGASPNTTWNVQAVLSVPIWDGGNRYGLLRDTDAQAQQAREQFEAGRRAAVIEVSQARRGIGVAEDRAKVSAEARKLAEDQDTLTRKAFQEGRGTSLELITSAQALRNAEIELVLRQFDVVQARVSAVLAESTCSY